MRSKHNSKRIRTLRRGRLALALVTAMAAPMAFAQNLPDSGTVTSGSASIGNPVGNQMTISQSTKGAIIDWNSFNIGAGYGVTFENTTFGASSVTLNRVLGFGYGGSPSYIDGMLSSTGNVFIINPSGIVFGSGAQVNVGGLVASTLDITDADFLSGVSSGQYRFTASGSLAGAIWNDGQLTATGGGTIGLIGSQINNAGTISATNGSVVFGATSQVTLDYFGDGLTQVTVSGNGLGVSDCTLNCNGGITSSGNVFAQGGHIEMRSNTMDGASAGNGLFVDPANGGRIWIGGNVAAQTSGTRRGSVIIDAGMGNIDLGGEEGKIGHVSAFGANAGEDGGTIELRGNQLFTHLCFGGGGQICVANNRLGLVNASAFGTGGSAGEIHIDVNRLYHGGVFQAVANDGSGGLIDINADNAEIYNRIWAYGNNGAGGTINIDANSVLLFRGQQPFLGGPGIASWSASLLAYGTTTGGTVNIDTGSLVVTDLGNVTPQFEDVVPVINVTGQLGGDGGVVNINADFASIGDTFFANASGEGQGGSIVISGDSIDLEGGLVATGTTGGTVTTTTTGSLFVGSTAYVNAGNWLVHAPSVDIVSAGNAISGYGAVLTDAALSSSLDGGTNVELFADGALIPGGSGDIHINGGVNIVHATSTAAGLGLSATGGIYGSYFDIQSTGGPLDLSFTANVNGDNPDGGLVSFYYIDLASNGGDIAMSGDGHGVYLGDSQVASGAGDITIFGSAVETAVRLGDTSLTSTGGDITIDGASEFELGVRLDNMDISTGGGNISIHGDGADGVSVTYSDLSSAGGDISIDGSGIYSGAYFRSSAIDSAAGDIAITGTASLDLDDYYPFGVGLAGTSVTSTSGDISVVGDALGGSGLQFGSIYDEGTQTFTYTSFTTDSGAISLASTGLNGLGLGGTTLTTNSGDIDLVGNASDDYATAAVFVSSSGLTTNGGNITITGNGGSTGVWLNGGDVTSNGGDITVQGEGFHYGVQVWDNLVSSGAGDTSIFGTATGGSSTGVNVRDASFTSTSGGITINGVAEMGTGVFFGGTGYGPGSSVTTTSGAIVVASTGLLGLNAANVPFSTDTGDITLEGHALGSGFGLQLGAGGLDSNGGNITLIGSSVEFTGVFIDGVDISSGGGDITISGSNTNGAGTQISGSDIDSAGGNIAIHGESATSTGLIVSSSYISSGAGGINLSGMGSGFGSGVSIGQESSVSTTSGDVYIDGTSSTYIGVLLNVGDVTTTSGDIGITGTGGTVGVRLSSGVLTSTSGHIYIDGVGGNDAGLSFSDSSVSTTSGAISIISTGLSGLNVANVPFSTDTGNITLQGTSLGIDAGVLIGAAGVSTNGGDITIIGESSAGFGAQVAGGGIASNGGDISIYGTSHGGQAGVILYAADLVSGVGSIFIQGEGGGFGALLNGGTTLSSTGGGIAIDGMAAGANSDGVLLYDADIASGSGDIEISGVGNGGMAMVDASISSTTGDIRISGAGINDAGIRMDADSILNAGSGLLSLAAGNEGDTDAIVLQGSIASTSGVNLRTVNEADTILLGAGNGFSLSSADLATIDAPLLVIGSAEHAGVIRVTEAVDWDDDLTLQNEGGNGGIDIRAAVDVGDNILALASGGDISQTSSGGITAHSLLAIAGGDVTLTAAQNNVAASSVAGSAGGDFAYQDVDDLAIGEVSSYGFSLVDNVGLVSLASTGIAAEGNVLVATASGNLTLGEDVTGSGIDLVAAGLFLNPAGASLTASQGWRIFASAPEGEDRGGLQGNGPDVFGCAFGQEVCVGLSGGNQFIYQEQGSEVSPSQPLSPTAPETVAEWFDEEIGATDLLMAAMCPVADAGDLLQAGASKDELGQEWLKSRHRMRLSNCIDSKNTPGCRF